MTYRYQGGCQCGNLSLLFETALAAEQLTPRACDCDFCTAIGATYLSDPQGRLDLTVKDMKALQRLRQGSGSAEFLQCGSCGVMVAVLFSDGGQQYAAINANTLKDQASFPASIPVSPKLLAPEVRRRRWRELWLADVSLRQL